MTITEIARLAGVSVSTVSKIVNRKDDSISAETRERVLAIVKEYNYRPYANAASPTGRSGIIGVLAQERLGMLVQGIVSKATKLGYATAIRTYTDSEDARRQLSSLLELRIDGVIVDGACGYPDLIKALESATVPHLLFNTKEDRADANLDYELLGFRATQELALRGHERIACMLGTGARVHGFFEGYRRCLFESGIPFDDELVFESSAGLPIEKVASHSFSGIVVSHFYDALRLYSAATELHYGVPFDFSIVSLRDDERQAPFPPISAIEIPRLSYGSHLADLLISVIEKTEPPTPFETAARLSSAASVDVPYTSRARHIVVVGSINTDNYLTLDVLPHPGATATTSSSQTFPGGKCLNEAIGVARLGHEAVAIGRVGDDADADHILRSLADDGVDTTGIARTQDKRTGQAFIFVPKDGESTITIMAGANDILSAQDVRACERAFAHASHCLVNTEVPLDAVRETLLLARKHGLLTIMKPSAVNTLPDDLMGKIDIMVPNEAELDALSPHDKSIDTKMRTLVEKGVGAIVVTLGAQGCKVLSHDTSKRIPAADLTAVDSTGAGDAFIAALASYLIRGYDLEQSARIATYAAGLSVTRQGASAALVDRPTLETYVHAVEPGLL